MTFELGNENLVFIESNQPNSDLLFLYVGTELHGKQISESDSKI